jgi:hypothetical protein
LKLRIHGAIVAAQQGPAGAANRALWMNGELCTVDRRESAQTAGKLRRVDAQTRTLAGLAGGDLLHGVDQEAHADRERALVEIERRLV